MSRVSTDSRFREGPFWLFCNFFPLFLMSLLELELEVAGLYEGVDEVVAFVCAQSANQGERLLDVAN